MDDTNLIAVFGDWHGDITQWGRLAINSAKRENVSHMVHVGDFGLDWPSRGRGRPEDRLNRFLAANDQTLVISSGNHDCMVRINKLPVDDDGLITWRSNIKILPKGGRTVIGHLTVGAIGGAYSIDRDLRVEGRDLWGSEEEPTVEQAERLIADGPVDILITHDAPMGVKVTPQFDLPDDVRERADRTRLLLADVVRNLQPPNLICGHWHQRVVDRIAHPGGGTTRVDVLGKEHDRDGNALILRPGSSGLRVEPLSIRGNRPGE